MNVSESRRGFTIVELLIVIIVIAILAAITIVAFNGVQAKARDAQRKQDLSSIAKLLGARATTNSDYLQSGSTCASRSEGFWNQTGLAPTGTDYGTNSAMDCLKETGLTSSTIRDPSGQTGCTTTQASTCFIYMYAQCANGTFLMTHLETEPITSSATNNVCPGNSYLWDSQFGMNYVVRAAV